MLKLIPKRALSSKFYLSLLYSLIRRKVKQDKSFYFAIKHSKREDENEKMSNVIDSIFYSKNLYDTLKVKCHPDKFNNENLKEIANKLFQTITENKGNYKVLQEIKIQAINQLQIKI